MSLADLLLGCSICYIAVLGFQPDKSEEIVLIDNEVSIRYIAVLGFQQLHLYYGLNSLYAFPSAISRYLVSNRAKSTLRASKKLWFPSAISRYLVSNIPGVEGIKVVKTSFHPLYRGTWFPTLHMLSILSSNPICFHPLYRGTWFPT